MLKFDTIVDWIHTYDYFSFTLAKQTQYASEVSMRSLIFLRK